MKMSNRTKDKIAIIIFLVVTFLIAIAVSVVFIMGINAVTKANAEEKIIELNGKEQMNKYYAEETIKAEIYYLAACETIETMTEEEYAETFLRG